MPADVDVMLTQTGFYDFIYPNETPHDARSTVELTFGSVGRDTRVAYWSALRFWLTDCALRSRLPPWHDLDQLDALLATMGTRWRSSSTRGVSSFGATRAALQKLCRLPNGGLRASYLVQQGWTRLDGRQCGKKSTWKVESIFFHPMWISRGGWIGWI